MGSLVSIPAALGAPFQGLVEVAFICSIVMATGYITASADVKASPMV